MRNQILDRDSILGQLARARLPKDIEWFRCEYEKRFSIKLVQKEIQSQCILALARSSLPEHEAAEMIKNGTSAFTYQEYINACAEAPIQESERHQYRFIMPIIRIFRRHTQSVLVDELRKLRAT